MATKVSGSAGAVPLTMLSIKNARPRGATRLVITGPSLSTSTGESRTLLSKRKRLNEVRRVGRERHVHDVTGNLSKIFATASSARMAFFSGLSESAWLA
jgi:hypothetical protein